MDKRQFRYNSLISEPAVFEEGSYKGYDYVIVDNGMFPTAYVSVSGVWNEGSLHPHGGITYLGVAPWNKEDIRTFIGWDYAHACDQVGNFIEGKIWTPEEVKEDIFGVIDALIAQKGV